MVVPCHLNKHLCQIVAICLLRSDDLYFVPFVIPFDCSNYNTFNVDETVTDIEKGVSIKWFLVRNMVFRTQLRRGVVMKIYHYTKSINVHGIFSDGCIATERKCSLTGFQSVTDFVWLTEKRAYPKTALPLLSRFPETSLLVHLQRKNVFVDLQKIGSFYGNFYRFSFDSGDARFKKWHFSQERKSLQSNQQVVVLDRVANKVGDDARGFWIATSDVALENFSLEVHEGGHWISLISDASITNLTAEQKSIVATHDAISQSRCLEFGNPYFACAA